MASTVADPREVARGAEGVEPFRPLDRPPAAVLVACDDGRRDGETFRLRGDRFVIGRTAGDLRIPHDGRISSRHVEIVRRQVDGRYVWIVADLRSRNGLFVRVSRASLSDGVEFLVGRGRYRFEAPSGRDRPPILTELVGGEVGARVRLVDEECWIGTDPRCRFPRPGDPFCEPRHARVYRNARGRWRVDHDRSLNGLWLRVEQITVDRSVHFQIGEQRFRLRP